MDDARLSERKKKILHAIVNAHIADGEPVGSKTLADDKSLSCSSATIRNEMAELEAMGYLAQPHTSAGRVPSALGYRYYVDSIRDRYEMTAGEIEALNLHLQEKIVQLDEILAEASRVAASLTNYTGISVKPRSARRTVSRFEVVYLGEHSLVLVMVFGDGVVKSKSMHVAFSVRKEDADLLSMLLNQHLARLTAEQITVAKICELERAMGYLAPIVTPVVKLVYETLTEGEEGQVRIEGVNRLLQYPEYSDMDKFRDILGLFEGNKEHLLNMVETSRDSEDDISVYIGKENTVDVMKDSTFVYRTIRRHGEVVGAIGVIGPCRMDYSKVIETLNRVAGSVDRLINEESEH